MNTLYDIDRLLIKWFMYILLALQILSLLIWTCDLPNWTYVLNVVSRNLCTCKLPNWRWMNLRNISLQTLSFQEKTLEMGVPWKLIWKESICYFALKLWYGITHVCKTIPYNRARGRWTWMKWETSQSIFSCIYHNWWFFVQK